MYTYYSYIYLNDDANDVTSMSRRDVFPSQKPIQLCSWMCSKHLNQSADFFWSLDGVTPICTSIYSILGGHTSTHLDLKTALAQEEILRFTLQLFQLAPKPPLVSGAEDCRDHNPAASVNQDPRDIPRCKYARLPLKCVFFNCTRDHKRLVVFLYWQKFCEAETRYCTWDPNAFRKVELGQWLSTLRTGATVVLLWRPCLKGVHRYRYTVHRAPRRLRPVWWSPMPPTILFQVYRSCVRFDRFRENRKKRLNIRKTHLKFQKYPKVTKPFQKFKHFEVLND